MEEDTKSKALFFGVIFFFIATIYLNTPSHSDETSAISQKITAEKYTYGLLKNRATWTDEYDDVYHMTALSKTSRVHYNYEPTKIEIWNLDIVTADGKTNRNIVMIYFLEGKYKGRWGYTLRAYTEI
ncbi:MAG: hypothetical protein J5809_02670 [Selenomonadaceae bacterium]|nr:hypothetical protein [Selenomonadaceae bacterium]